MVTMMTQSHLRRRRGNRPGRWGGCGRLPLPSGRACKGETDSMRVIEVREDNPWPKWTEATQVVEGMHKPVFVRPVLAKRDDGEIAWPSVQIRIGGLGARQGAKFNGHTLAEAKEKADRLRADAQSSGHSGTVPFKVQLRKTAVNTKLTPAEVRRVAQAIDEARRLLSSAHPKPREPSGPHRPTLLEALARLKCFERKKEDVAVEVLGHILSTSEAARAALSDLVVAGGAPVGRIDRVETQVRGRMGAKPDLAGYDESGREHVLIEAKFTAKLTPHQGEKGTYLKRLLRQKRQPSVVLFVAPAERREELWKDLLDQVSKSKIELRPWHQKGTVLSAAVADSACWLMLTSWKALLDRMQAGVSADSVVEAHLRELRWLVDWQPPSPSR